MSRMAQRHTATTPLAILVLTLLLLLTGQGGGGSPARFLACAATAVLSTALATPLAIAVGRLQFFSRPLVYALVVFASATPPMLLARGDSLHDVSAALAIGIPIAFWTIYLPARALPRGIEDASELDGASPTKVLLPVLRPALATATTMVFLFCWFDLARFSHQVW